MAHADRYHTRFIREPPLTAEQQMIRARLARLLEWHTLESDLILSDFDFIRAVFQRVEAHFQRPLIDPNE